MTVGEMARWQHYFASHPPGHERIENAIAQLTLYIDMLIHLTQGKDYQGCLGDYLIRYEPETEQEKQQKRRQQMMLEYAAWQALAAESEARERDSGEVDSQSSS